MKRIFTLCAVALSLCAGSVMPSYAAKQAANLRQLRYKQLTENPFRFAPKVDPTKPRLTMSGQFSGPTKMAAKTTITASDHQLPASDGTIWMETPKGDIWYATYTLKYEEHKVSESYTERNYTGIELDIYDSNYKKIGHVSDTFTAPEGYSRCSQVQVASLVTQKFFNYDNNYEVMVSCIYNPPVGYGSQAFTKAYSLKGAETDATKVFECKGYYSAAVNNPIDPFSENVFMIFHTGEEYTDEDMFYTFTIYGKPGYGDNGPVNLLDIRANMLYVMSDGTNEVIPVMINSRGSELYATVTRYEKTFFEDPFDVTNDKLSEDNHFLIDVYHKTASGKELTLEKQLSVPVQAPDADYTTRSYSLGMFLYTDDINFDFSTDGKPLFILTERQGGFNDNSPSTISYGVYNNDGQRVKQFGVGSSDYITMSPIKGQSEQICFITSDNDMPVYSFVDFPSLETVVEIPAVYQDDQINAMLSTSLDRVQNGDSYDYVFSATQGISEDDGNTYHPMLWFDKEGNLKKIDKAIGGQNVNKIQVYVSAEMIDPYFINTDANHEYILLVQRLNAVGSAASHTEMCVVNDKGETLVRFPFETKDNAIYITPVRNGGKGVLWITWVDAEDGKTHSEFISLPLNKLEGEGTEASPYILRTPGDWAQVQYNPSSHFALGCDIDFNGLEISPVGDVFTGSLDGAGHTMKNFSLSDKSLFEYLGRNDLTANIVIKDLTLSHVKVTGNASALLAKKTYHTTLENVHIYDAQVDYNGQMDFGAFANRFSTGSVMTGCSVNANIFPEITDDDNCDGVGGLVYTLSASEIKASAFTGSIKASSNVAGIASEISKDSKVSDCHVDATLQAKNNIGGIVAHSLRGQVLRCIAEGDITATEVQQRYNYNYQPIYQINVGGIIGRLEAPSTTTSINPDGDDTSEADVLVKGNIVALGSITLPADAQAEALETAHRIVGFSSINEEPEIVDEQYDEDSGDWVAIYGDPRPAETKLADNYALSDLAVITATPGADLTTTEGKSVGFDEIDADLYTALEYGFNGYAAEQPWVNAMMGMPELWFEKTVGAEIVFNPAEISLKVGEKKQVELVLSRVEFDALSFEASDETNFIYNPIEFTENGVLIEVEVLKEGSYTLTASNGSISGTLTVAGLSGIENVDADSAAALTFSNGTLFAQGQAIKVYDLTGKQLLSGANALSTKALAPGVYVAATASSTLKFVIR